MRPTKSTPNLSDLTAMALKFRAERDWEQFHTPKELAVSLMVEAAELLELMQWRQGAELTQHLKKKRTDVADEIGDCLHSLLLLANDLKVDLAEAFVRKLRKTGRKYPVAKAKGRPDKSVDLK